MNVAATSIATYHSRKFQSEAQKARAMIEDYLLRRGGPVTRHEIARDLGIETGTVSGRICEMKGYGRVKQLPGTKECPVTGNPVTWVVHEKFWCPVQEVLL